MTDLAVKKNTINTGLSSKIISIIISIAEYIIEK